MAKSPEKKEEKKPSCFVIMPIADQKGYDDGHFTLVYEDIIKPAIIAAGMEVEQARADEVKNANLIHLDILRKVIESDIAICDMSSRNPNVFYELGMRQAFDKPTVLIRDEDTMVPFDINGLRYVEYKKGMRHRDVVKAVEDLTSMLKATYEKKDDKSEVNSLIRLMDLTAAKVQHVELTEDEKSSKLIEIKLASLTDMIEKLSRKMDSADTSTIRSKLDFSTSPKASRRIKLNIMFSGPVGSSDLEEIIRELDIYGDAVSIKPPHFFSNHDKGLNGVFTLTYDPRRVLLAEVVDSIKSHASVLEVGYMAE